MTKQLQSRPCPSAMATRMFTILWIVCLLFCNSAYSQPEMLAEIPGESENFIAINENLYYSLSGDLMTATPVSGPELVKSTGETILEIYDITLGGNFFFVTENGSTQRLWRSDGTSANTLPVFSEKEITPLLAYQSQLFLEVNSSSAGIELWKMDASFNVSILKDINPGTANGFGGNLIIHNNLLYFFGNSGSGEDLWKSDGTTTGTVESVDIENPEETDYWLTELTSVDNYMFFARTFNDPYTGDPVTELWKSDGTPEETLMLVHYPANGMYNSLSHFLAFKGKLYFFHLVNTPDVYLMVSDGTTSGTQQLEHATIDGYPRKLINAGDYFLYYTDSQSFTNSLKKSDGTTISTLHDWSMYHSAFDAAIGLTYTEGRVFFNDAIGEIYGGGSSLWQADLATGVTRPLQEMYNTPVNGVMNIVPANGSIYFTRIETGNQTLWYYDPSDSPTTCGNTGNIYQEIWTNVSGADVRTFNFETQPTGTPREFTSFETTQYYANNYASRMRGLICVPQTGNYTFWISSDDSSQLLLGTNSTGESKRLIAWVYGHTPFRKYDKYPSQQSAQIFLEAGRQYYIEVRHKEANGNDFVSVGWQLPDGTLELPIPGNRLTAIVPEPNDPPSITITSPQADQSLPSGPVLLSATVNDPDGVLRVEFDIVSEDGTTNKQAILYGPPFQHQWNNAQPGRYQFIVTAVDRKHVGTSQSVEFTVYQATCEGTGTVVREIWRNIPGTSVSTIPVNLPPDNIETLTSLSTPNYYANNYGSRIRGYLCPPATGSYNFYIAGDDNCELWIGIDDTPKSKRRIASVPGATRINQFDKYTTQFGNVVLRQGQRYYFEILHKEANGADHVEVAWDLPDGTSEVPIPGNRLIPFEDASTSAARFAADKVFDPEDETSFSVSPNPVVSGRQVSITLPASANGLVALDMKSITGVTVQQELLSTNDNMVTFDLKPSIAAGMYLIQVSHEKKRWITKLQVK